MAAMKLTERQQHIVRIEETTENPYIACLASAGSGKSTVIENRVAHVVNDLNVRPQKIAVFSFSRAATKEIRTRLKAKLGTGKFNDLTVSTLHSFAYHLVRNHYKEGITKINIFGQSQLFKTAKSFVERASLDSDMSGIDAEFFVEEYSASRKQNRRPSFVGEYWQLYQKIRDWMAERSLYTYDDLLYLTYKILSENDDLRQTYSNQYDYWFIDEAQDTTQIMIDIVEILLRKDTKLMMSFDIVQSLYQFAGADPFYLMAFLDRINAQIVQLDETFRFGPTVAKLADEVVRNIDLDERYKMFTRTHQVSNNVMYIPGSFERTNDICDDIEQKVHSGVSLNDISVLSRTNKPLVDFQKQLAKRGIPSKMRFGYFWNRKEIKLLLTIVRLFRENMLDDLLYVTKNLNENFDLDKKRLRLMYSEHHDDNVLEFLRYFLNNKVKGIGVAIKGGIRKLISYFEQVNGLLTDESRDENTGLFAAIAEAMNFSECEFMRDIETQEGTSNVEERWQFIDVLDSIRNEKEKDPFEIENLLKIEFTTEDEDEADAVQLKTIHSSKGETLPHVYLLADTFNPRFMATEDDLRSELFVLYVAITRTKTELQIWGQLPTPFTFLHKIDMDVFLDDEEELEEPDEGGPKTLLEEIRSRTVIQNNRVRQPVAIDVVSAMAETAKAVRMKVRTLDQREVEQWIPKSQMTVLNDQIAIARWLATKNRFN